MDARAYKMAAKLMVKMIKGVVQKAVEGDMQAVKEYCEKQSDVG